MYQMHYSVHCYFWYAGTRLRSQVELLIFGTNPGRKTTLFDAVSHSDQTCNILSLLVYWVAEIAVFSPTQKTEQVIVFTCSAPWIFDCLTMVVGSTRGQQTYFWSTENALFYPTIPQGNRLIMHLPALCHIMRKALAFRPNKDQNQGISCNITN